MNKQLSTYSTSAAYGYLAATGLLVLITMLLAIMTPLSWAWCFYGSLVAAQLIYQLTFYQVMLSGDTLVITRVFTKTSQYPAHDFVALEELKTYGKPMRVRFADGRSFAFLPKLKTSKWSISYLLPAVFIKHRTHEIKLAAGLTATD